MTSLEAQADELLAYWMLGCVSSAQVVEWADQRLLANANPALWLIDLSASGPAEHAKHSEGPKGRELSFTESFRAKVEATDAQNLSEIDAFISWLTQEVLGEDLSDPNVKEAHHIDLLWDDCADRNGARSLATDLVRARKEKVGPIARLLEQPKL